MQEVCSLGALRRACLLHPNVTSLLGACLLDLAPRVGDVRGGLSSDRLLLPAVKQAGSARDLDWRQHVLFVVSTAATHDKRQRLVARKPKLCRAHVD